jgi:hypothetical protein
MKFIGNALTLVFLLPLQGTPQGKDCLSEDGAGLPESPILGIRHPEERLTVFLIPVGRWSDGSPSVSEQH